MARAEPIKEQSPRQRPLFLWPNNGTVYQYIEDNNGIFIAVRINKLTRLKYLEQCWMNGKNHTYNCYYH